MAEKFPYEVVTAPRGNRFGARSLEQVEEFKRIWTVTEFIDNAATQPTGQEETP